MNPVNTDQARVIHYIGRLQGLLDAVCECRLIDHGCGDDLYLADVLLNKAMSIAEAIMEETKVSVDDQAE